MYTNELELLAPAGKWEVMVSAAEAGADAIYLGGKRFNMRMLKTDFNFSDRELIQAVDYLHARNKNLYVTINNLYYDDEIEQLKDYLLFLQEINVDALIIQDMGVVDLYNQLEISVPLHGSVQMGIGNSQAVKFLQEKGFSRVILSKNLTLKEISEIHNQTDMIIEYFAHGDLCVSHTGQCYMSNLIFNESSNRGRCKKPCRWKYRIESWGIDNPEYRYYLANNDLCLCAHIRELAAAGVSSFKIEGRMRTAEYVAYLINNYRKALDQVIQDPQCSPVDELIINDLHLHRIRDYTAGNLFGQPGMESIGLSGEREPFFPTESIKLEPLFKNEYKNITPQGENRKMELTVKAGTLQVFQQLINSDVDNIIISLDFMQQNPDHWTFKQINQALSEAPSQVNIFLETPRIVTEGNLRQVEKSLNLSGINRVTGYVVNDYGSLNMILKSCPEDKLVWGGTGLNITNSRSARLLNQSRMSRLSISLEVDFNCLSKLTALGIDTEVMVHGPLCGLITDLCITGSLNSIEGHKCSGWCRQGNYALIDEHRQTYTIRTDYNCRNYLFYPYDLCLYPYLPALAKMGVKSIKIEGQYYDFDVLIKVVNAYREALTNLKNNTWEPGESYNQLLAMFPKGLTAVPLVRNTECQTFLNKGGV